MSDSLKEGDEVIEAEEQRPSHRSSSNRKKRKCFQSLRRCWKSCGATTRQMFGIESKESDSDSDMEREQERNNNNDEDDDEEDGMQFVQVDILRHDLNDRRDFPGNSIHTAKYTIYSALPLSILFQFNKVSNIYFLLVMVITLIPGASPINPLSAIVPFCIVLGVGVLKDLWEDVNRSKADREANNMPAQVLVQISEEQLEREEREKKEKQKKQKKKNKNAKKAATPQQQQEAGEGAPPPVEQEMQPAEEVREDTQTGIMRAVRFEPIPSKDLRPGDVVLLRLGEEVKADCVILNTSLPDGLTYIETANLDGETNAKTRRAHYSCVEQLTTVEDIVEFSLSSYLRKRKTNEWPRRGLLKKGCCSCFGRKKKASKEEKESGEEEEEEDVRLDGRNRVDVMDDPVVVRVPSTASEALTPPLSAQGSSVFPPHRPLTQQFLEMSRNGAATHSPGTAPLPAGGADDEVDLLSPVRYDEKLEREGVLPPPKDMLELSRRYEAQQQTPKPAHSRTGSLSLFATRFLNREEVEDSTDGSPSRPGTGASPSCDPSTFQQGVVLLGSKPCPDLYSWFGQLRLPGGGGPTTTNRNCVIPLSIEQFIPRGCIIRNTNWVLAAVLYTGKDTKMLLNLKPKKYKTTVMTQRLNQLNLLLFIVSQVAIFILCGLAVWNKKEFNDTPGNGAGQKTWYLQWNNNRYSDVQLFFWRYLTNFVLLSYLIPLSLYVTLEINKGIQLLMIAADRRMAVFDEFSGKLRFARPKTSELNCQLAQVQYVFTDKTGTLTENLMTYVGGRAWTVTHDERETPGGLGLALMTQLLSKQEKQQQREEEGGEEANPHCDPNEDDMEGDGGVVSSGAIASSLRQHTIARVESASREFPRSFSSSPTPTRPSGGGGGKPLSIMPSAAEEYKIEENPIFKYLRSLVLCHSVVCFDAVDSAGQAETEKAEQKRKKKEEKKKKKKKVDKSDPKYQKACEKKRKKREKKEARKELEAERAKKRDAKERRRLLLELNRLQDKRSNQRFYISNAVPSGPGDDGAGTPSLRGSLHPSRRDSVYATTEGNVKGSRPLTLSPGRYNQPEEDYHYNTNPHTPQESVLQSDLSFAASFALHQSTNNAADLPSPSVHGRVGSSAWYYNRFNANATHSTRNNDELANLNNNNNNVNSSSRFYNNSQNGSRQNLLAHYRTASGALGASGSQYYRNVRQNAKDNNNNNNNNNNNIHSTAVQFFSQFTERTKNI